MLQRATMECSYSSNCLCGSVRSASLLTLCRVLS